MVVSGFDQFGAHDGARLGLYVAAVAATVLLIDYFIQVTVMQPSLEKGLLDGWATCTQYNPNSVSSSLSRSSDTS